MSFLNKLSFLVDSSHKQGNSLPHILLKTDDFSLARHFANEAAEMMISQMICIDDGLDINKIGDFAGVLTNLKKNDILLLEDVNRFNLDLNRYLVDALNNFSIALCIDADMARVVEVKLNKFTLIATTPKLLNVNKKVLSSFFCVMEEEEIKDLGEETALSLLTQNQFKVESSLGSFIQNTLKKRGIEVISFVKNLMHFLSITGFDKSEILTIEKVGNYLEFAGFKESSEAEATRCISPEVKREVWRRDEAMCVVCKSQERLEFDHIIPFSKGGSNTSRNIQLLCESCNRSKGSNI